MINKVNGNQPGEYSKVEYSADKVVKSSAKNNNTDKSNKITEDKFAKEGKVSLKDEKRIKDALNDANQKARVKRTNCEFAYDDATNRISITVKDRETDEVIRQIPAEETLEMISKLWEQAGIILDEKR